MEERRALARVVRKAEGAEISRNDLIANVMFDADRVLNFFVWGDFDLDHTNNSRVHEADFERVLSLIEDYGGAYRTLPLEILDAEQIRADLPLTTDYLILGEEPAVPQDPVRLPAWWRSKHSRLLSANMTCLLSCPRRRVTTVLPCSTRTASKIWWVITSAERLSQNRMNAWACPGVFLFVPDGVHRFSSVAKMTHS